MRYFKQDKKNKEITEVTQQWAVDMASTTYTNPVSALKNSTKTNPLQFAFSYVWAEK